VCVCVCVCVCDLSYQDCCVGFLSKEWQMQEKGTWIGHGSVKPQGWIRRSKFRCF
jgi:hypothetical protein